MILFLLAAQPHNVRARGERHAISCKLCVRAEEGDYFQIWLEVKDSAKEAADPHEVDGPYVIVQRDFEMPDGGRCSTALQSP
jgi:hypothetical protein